MNDVDTCRAHDWRGLTILIEWSNLWLLGTFQQRRLRFPYSLLLLHLHSSCLRIIQMNMQTLKEFSWDTQEKTSLFCKMSCWRGTIPFVWKICSKKEITKSEFSSAKLGFSLTLTRKRLRSTKQKSPVTGNEEFAGQVCGQVWKTRWIFDRLLPRVHTRQGYPILTCQNCNRCWRISFGWVIYSALYPPMNTTLTHTCRQQSTNSIEGMTGRFVCPETQNRHSPLPVPLLAPELGKEGDNNSGNFLSFWCCCF